MNAAGAETSRIRAADEWGEMVWAVLFFVSVGVLVIYGFIGQFGGRWGIGQARLSIFRRSSFFGGVWAILSAGHYLLLNKP